MKSLVVNPRRAILGMTLLEILIVIMIMALVAATALPAMRYPPEDKLDLVETQVSNALGYAMYLSGSTGETHGVVFDVASEGFAVVDATGSPVADPLNRGGYVVTFDRPGQPFGIDFTTVDFGVNSPAAIYAPDGLPETGGTVTFTCKGVIRSITVLESTGKIEGS